MNISSGTLTLPAGSRAAGDKLFYQSWMPDAPRAVVLLAHGYAEHLGRYDHVADRFGRDQIAVFAIDHWGHGRSDGIRGFVPNFSVFQDGLEALLTFVKDTLPGLPRILVGHSMGGLVARSALAQAAEAGQRWPQKVRQLVFLGTPHHGAPLERAGNWLHRVMDLSPYAAPFTRLSRLRSEGITDLRHGNLLASDWQGHARYDHADRRTPVPLPAGVDCYAIASTVGGQGSRGSLLGDGLVPVDSALGHHKRRAFDLGIPESHQWVGHGIHHLDLLSDPAVYRRLLSWLSPH